MKALPALACLLGMTLGAAGDAAPLPARSFARPCEHGAARLTLELGPLPRGVEIVVYGEDGRLIGTAAPFALRGGQSAGTFQFVLPEALFRDGAIALRLAAKQYGVPERAPTALELRRASVVCAPMPR